MRILKLALVFLSLCCLPVVGQTCLQRAEKIFREVILGNQWAGFGHIAAEVELSR